MNSSHVKSEGSPRPSLPIPHPVSCAVHGHLVVNMSMLFRMWGCVREDDMPAPGVADRQPATEKPHKISNSNNEPTRANTTTSSPSYKVSGPWPTDTGNPNVVVGGVIHCQPGREQHQTSRKSSRTLSGGFLVPPPPSNTQSNCERPPAQHPHGTLTKKDRHGRATAPANVEGEQHRTGSRTHDALHVCV